jgi:hypothetical protein
MQAPSPPPPRPPVQIVAEQEFIVVYQALDAAQCRAVIEQFEQDPAKWRGKVGQPGVGVAQATGIKDSWDLEILDQGAWQPLFRSIHPKIMACFADYLSRSPILQSFDLQATGYKIQAYRRHEGYFRWHSDSAAPDTRNRVAAMVLFLNDVAEGGETEFFHQGVKITPRAGQLLMFPTGWTFMHCGQVPVSGDKYIIQSFLKVKD